MVIMIMIAVDRGDSGSMEKTLGKTRIISGTRKQEGGTITRRQTMTSLSTSILCRQPHIRVIAIIHLGKGSSMRKIKRSEGIG